jgi:hypothetical protein
LVNRGHRQRPLPRTLQLQYELDEFAANLARITAGDPDALTTDEQRLRSAIDAMADRLDEAEHRYATELAGHDLGEARDRVLSETGNHSLANRVAHQLWESSIPSLSDEEFRALTEELVSTLDPMRIDFSKKMIALDVECDRRGMPCPPPLLDCVSGAR